MLRKVVSRGLLVCAAVLVCASSASAQKQTLNLTLGYFTPLPVDARTNGDVLNENLTFLLFDISDFNSASIGGEWLVPLTRHVEGGIGVSYSKGKTHSVYLDYVDPDGTEVDQDLSMRLVPFAFTVRFLPLAPRSPVQPYFGAGIGVINWRYSESGEFIDFGAGNVIFRDTFVADGTETGPVVLGGVRFQGETFSAGGEVRYQHATADLDNRFAAPRLDLGGLTYNVTVGVRF